MNIGTATVEVKSDTSAVIRTARIIARHLTAMADELELESRRETEEGS